ncbi:hypothetical protein H6P81_016097 [Aristolochia fimbriata]|uniref:Uncharacterized protein n=1 Tax=Aristolochia fimbriata TaxID=158543 RepID=A0AAV7E7D3_ARIFI|nr:hypothetical protein H6P81_016097 [Aristolochia fimbriata]
MWKRRGYQVRLLEPETPAEEELLVAPHQSNARCNHEESEHLKERISHLEAELANFRSTADERFKEMEARFVSTLTMHPLSSNVNVEIHGHGDREDHSWGNSGGIGVPEDVSVDVAEKCPERWETSVVDERTNNEREKVTGEDEGNNNPILSSIVRGVKEQRRKRKDGPQLKPPFATFERKKVKTVIGPTRVENIFFRIDIYLEFACDEKTDFSAMSWEATTQTNNEKEVYASSLKGSSLSGKEVVYAHLVKIQKREMKMLICASVENLETANMLSDSRTRVLNNRVDIFVALVMECWSLVFIVFIHVMLNMMCWNLKNKTRIAKSNNVFKGSRAARIKWSKMMRDQKRAAVLKEKRTTGGSSSPPRVIVSV